MPNFLCVRFALSQQPGFETASFCWNERKIEESNRKGRAARCHLRKYVEGPGVDLFNEVCQRNLEGVVAKRKSGTYATVSGWLEIKNPNYTQSERRDELFDSFKPKQKALPPIPKKPPVRTRPLTVRAKKVSSG